MNIPETLNEVQFAAIITASFGEIEKSYLRNNQKTFRENNKEKIKNRKYGFVTFKTKESRDKAVNQGSLIDPQSRKWLIKAFQSKNESRNQKMKQLEVKEFQMGNEYEMLRRVIMFQNQVVPQNGGYQAGHQAWHEGHQAWRQEGHQAGHQTRYPP